MTFTRADVSQSEMGDISHAHMHSKLVFHRDASCRGATYGLVFNWRKLEILPSGCDAFISKPGGQFIQCEKSISYLGAWLVQGVQTFCAKPGVKALILTNGAKKSVFSMRASLLN